MTEQHDSLGEKTKLVDISLKYTGGDIDKAKEMVSGKYLDNIVVKGKFLIEKRDLSGMFLAFFNYIDEYISHVTSVIFSKTEIFGKVRIFDDWKILYKDILAYKKGDDIVDSQNFNYFLVDSFISHDIFPDVNERNLDELTRTVNEIISKSFDMDDARSQLELESTSSLEMSMSGIKIDLPGAEDRDEDRAEDFVEDERITQIESEANYIVEGKAIVSPVKGKNLVDLKQDDKIKVELPGNDLISEKILRLLNAFDEDGNRLPIKGRVKAKIPMDKSGYIIYAFVAKGVLAKIYEEENVKIELDKPVSEKKEELKNIDNRLIYLMGIIVGLIILAAIILFQLL